MWERFWVFRKRNFRIFRFWICKSARTNHGRKLIFQFKELDVIDKRERDYSLPTARMGRKVVLPFSGTSDSVVCIWLKTKEIPKHHQKRRKEREYWLVSWLKDRGLRTLNWTSEEGERWKEANGRQFISLCWKFVCYIRMHIGCCWRHHMCFWKPVACAGQCKKEVNAEALQLFYV